MMREQLYTAACLIAATRDSKADGTFAELSEMAGLKSFVAALAKQVAMEAVKK